MRIERFVSAWAVEHLADALLLVALDGSILDANQAAVEYYKCSREELLALTVHDIRAEQDREFIAEQMRKTLERGARFEAKHRRCDGSVFPVEVRSTRVEFDGEAAILANIRDISDRVAAREALAVSEDRFRALFEQSIVAMSLTKPGGEVRVNPAFCRLLGYSEQEMAEGATWRQVSHPDDVPETERYIEALLSGEMASARFEKRYLRKDGGVVWADLSTSLRRDSKGEPEYFMTTIVDITERKQSQKELLSLLQDLERSNWDLEQFAYVASHDLQEPLRMVASYTELLSQRYLGRLDKDADEFIGFARDGAKRMQAMLDDLLDYSRVGTRGQQPRPVKAKSAIDQSLLNLATSIEESHAEVIVGDMPSVMADKTQLLRVFQNLLGNAVKFHRPGEPPRIEITASREGASWRFSVADNGIGINPDGFKQVFEVFRRMVPRDQYPGTGIGLSVSRRIVDRLGGNMWVESSGPTGTTLCFTLPAVP